MAMNVIILFYMIRTMNQCNGSQLLGSLMFPLYDPSHDRPRNDEKDLPFLTFLFLTSDGKRTQEATYGGVQVASYANKPLAVDSREWKKTFIGSW